MLFVSLLLVALGTAPAPAPPARPVLPAEGALSPVWVASRVVAADGELRVLPGWRVRVGIGERASLIGPVPRAHQALGPWDDHASVDDVRVAVRVASHDERAIYVAGRLLRGGQSVSFLLRWDTASGTWTDAA